MLKRFNRAFALVLGLSAAALTVLLAGCISYASPTPNPPPVLTAGDLSIHFLELGNRSVGDCVFIKQGNIDILIDAGSTTGSKATIKNYLARYVTDGKLEYVIATHADTDHIAAFYPTGSGKNRVAGILESYSIGTIIDYPNSEKDTVTRSNYEAARDAAIAAGAVHYTALQCFNNENGAERIIDIAPDLEMEILYNYYYDHDADVENEYSVCMILRRGGDQFLFTGDLESDGEQRLVSFYDNLYPGTGLGHCVLFKGGHHGSSTSSTKRLLDAITPEYVCICTTAGSTQYSDTPANQFPTQEFINRIAAYTDHVYINTVAVGAKDFAALNGTLIFVSRTDDTDPPIIYGSNNNTKLKDSTWFRANRTTPREWQ